MLFFIGITVLLTIYCTFMSLAHGGTDMENKVGRFIDDLSLEAWFLALPILPIVYLIDGNFIWPVLCYLIGVLGFRTGHGRGMSLKEPMKPNSKPEKVEYLIFYLQDKLSTYKYKLLILILTGLFSFTLPAIYGMLEGQWLVALIFALTGISKGLAYVIGWEVYPNNDEGYKATQLAEGLRGTFLGLFYGLLIYLTYTGV